MQDPTGDELRRLRERAYGPDADIDGDPAAVERLRELEAAASVPLRPVTGEVASGTDAGEDGSRRVVPRQAETVARRDDGASATAQAEGVDASGGTEETPSDAPRASGEAEEAPGAAPRRRRPVLITAVALVVALLVGASLTYGITQLRPGSVATLAAAPDAEWPEFLGDRQEGSAVFEEFFGLTVAVVPKPWGRENDVPCLFVLHASGSPAISTVGCGAGGFAPTASLAVNESLPDALLAQFPVGSALQFVLRDGEVAVYADRG